MRLPVQKITEDFEGKLKDKIEHNIIKAKIREATASDLETLKNINGVYDYYKDNEFDYSEEVQNNILPRIKLIIRKYKIENFLEEI